jgi:hypothetical protein
MSLFSIEEQIQTERQLGRTNFSVFFTLTTGTERDDPLNLRNLGYQFIQRIARKQGKYPKYWFAVCMNTDDSGRGQGLYHIHGFLGDVNGVGDIQKLRTCWRTSYRDRDKKTGIRKKLERSLGRSDFQRLAYSEWYVFEYSMGQAVLEPCTNVALLKPSAIRRQVDIECGDLGYVI